MDYSADPSNNTAPNQHDYDQLQTIYAHDCPSEELRFYVCPIKMFAVCTIIPADAREPAPGDLLSNPCDGEKLSQGMPVQS